MEIQYKYINKNTRKLVICFQEITTPLSVMEGKEKRECYNYHDFFIKLDIDVLFIQDTFSELCGWYVLNNGNTNDINTLSSFIETFIKSNNYDFENVFLFGFSKGGFASLFYGNYIEKIKNVIAICPQISLYDWLDNPKSEEDKNFFPSLKKSIGIDKKNSKYFIDIISRNSVDNLILITSERDYEQYPLQKEILETNSIFMVQNDEHNDVPLKVMNIVENTIMEYDETYLLTIVVPIYNTSKIELFRFFKSVLNMKYFKKIKILLVDDGSKKVETINTARKICDTYRNVDYIIAGEIASGSAAKPRNIGLSMTTTPFVTFFDPDDEYIMDGLNFLFENENTSKMYVGKCLIKSGGNYGLNYKKNFSPVQNLINTNYAPMGMMGCIFSTQFLKDKNLEFEIGTFGEDTLFYLKAINELKKGELAIIDSYIYLYYDNNSTSAMNDLGISYFEKINLGSKCMIEYYKNNTYYKDFIVSHYNNKIKFYINQYNRYYEINGRSKKIEVLLFEIMYLVPFEYLDIENRIIIETKDPLLFIKYDITEYEKKVNKYLYEKNDFFMKNFKKSKLELKKITLKHAKYAALNDLEEEFYASFRKRKIGKIMREIK